MASSKSRYMLYKKIARGGMAEIYLGKLIGEDGFQRICCIKRILPHYAQDADFIEMFRDEAHICKRLQHANIVRVEGFEEVEGSYAIIMEYVNGADLRTILSFCERQGTRFSVPMALFITAEIARGLHFAHTKIDDITGKALEIVHRDISPQNILLSYEGEVKVTDFGIADAESKATETKPGIVKGKYSYMSPEQISAKPVDARTDVFAACIVLWEMLAMKRLFQGDNEVMTIQLVKSCKITRDLRSLNPDVDPELYQIIVKGLSKDVRDRYESAADLERDLRHYLSKKYAKFTAADLGGFLKELLQKKLQESQEDIKTILSAESSPQQKASSGIRSTPSLSLSLEEVLNATSLRVKNDDGQLPAGPLGVAQNNKVPLPVARKTMPQTAPAQRSPAPGMQGRGGSGRGSYSRHRSASDMPFLLTMLLLVVLAGGGAWLFSRQNSSSGSPAALEISTTPDVVRLALDGKALFDDHYKETKPPIVIKTTPGAHVLSMFREGYEDLHVRFTAEAGKQLRKHQDLKAEGPIAPIRISLAPHRVQRVKVEINDGIFSGVLDGKEDLDVNYISFGKKHRLKVFPPGNEGAFSCDFVPRATTWGAPFLIHVYLEDKLCKNPPR